MISDGTSYFDLQLNGYKGVDFNSDALTADGLHEACTLLRADGVGGVLVTVITDSLECMTSRLAKIAAIHGHDPLVREIVRGVHIEGPFLNETPGFVGAHPAEQVRPASVEAAEQLLEAADGLTRLVTLAPERDEGLATTRFLADRGIIVAAGHSDASLEQLRAAIDAGLSMFTHLGNGCPLMLPRHDNIIQRVLSLADRLWISFIADGVHVADPALETILRLGGARAGDRGQRWDGGRGARSGAVHHRLASDRDRRRFGGLGAGPIASDRRDGDDAASRRPPRARSRAESGDDRTAHRDQSAPRPGTR